VSTFRVRFRARLSSMVFRRLTDGRLGERHEVGREGVHPRVAQALDKEKRGGDLEVQIHLAVRQLAPRHAAPLSELLGHRWALLGRTRPDNGQHNRRDADQLERAVDAVVGVLRLGALPAVNVERNLACVGREER